jgi:uncharacterized membrane protein YcfT
MKWSDRIAVQFSLNPRGINSQLDVGMWWFRGGFGGSVGDVVALAVGDLVAQWVGDVVAQWVKSIGRHPT